MENLLIFGEPLMMRSKRRECRGGFQALFLPNPLEKLGRTDEFLQTLAPFAESGVVFDKPQSDPRVEAA